MRKPITMRATLVAAALAVVAIGAGCADLDVANPNEPDRERALSDALAVQSLVSGSFQTWWEITQGRAPGRMLANAAHTHESSSFNHGTWDAGHLPPKAVVNQPGYGWGYPIDDPWNLLNRANSAIRDALLMVEGGLQIGADTQRLRAFAKFMLGLNHGFLAMLYDQGFTVDETVDTEAQAANRDLKPYDEVMEAALGYLTEARQIATANSFTIPGGWMGDRAYSSAQLVRLSHSYSARMMTAGTRSPADRAAVNWNAVLSHIDQGITEDFGVEMTGPGGLYSNQFKSTSSETGGVGLRLLGPADQSGAWQAWEATEPRARQWFYVETDDRRIHAPGDRTQSGTLFQLLKASNGAQEVQNDAARGLWFQTPYSSFAWRSLAENSRGFAPDMTVEEMDFLRAEAYIRLGRPADALPIINRTRVANGGLPPATVDGVSGARCVPRKLSGQCGNLMDVLVYEKSLETLWLSAGLDYFDARGFGTLYPGTFLHLPVPAVELGALNIPVYTFGGDAGGGVP